MGGGVLMYGGENNMVVSRDGKLLVMQGVDDLLVVDTDEILMICKKGNEGDIRRFLNDAKMKLGDKMA
jgi:mannose-1-phosphate guanylyltransferase